MLPASPNVLLRIRLASLRAQGVDFGEAWFTACAGVWLPYFDRSAWTELLSDPDVRETWRRCYEREPPTPLEAALAAVRDDVTEIGEDPPSRMCELDGCERALHGRSRLTRYCCEQHRKTAARLREREGRVAHLGAGCAVANASEPALAVGTVG
jgi:hypothetical protein